MDIEFRLTGSQKVSEEEYINRMAALEDFASCLSNLSVSINENPWYGFKQHDTTHEEREDCKAKCKKLFACNTRLIEAVNQLNNIVKVNYNPALPLVKDIVGMLSTLLQIPSLFPEHYLTIGNLSNVNKTIQTASELTTSVKQLRSTLDNTFYPSVYNLDADKLDALLNENITYLTETLSSQTYPSKNFIMDQLECLQSRVEEASVFSDKLASIIDILNNKYDLFIDSNNPDIASVRKKLQAILRLPKVCKFWFNSEKQSYIKGILKDCTQNSSRLNSCITKIGTTFDDDIYRENIDFLVKKFRSDYSTNLRIIKPQYYKDKKTIQQYVKSHVGTLKHKDVCWYLELLKETKEDKYWFQQNDSLLDEMFDEYYQGEETDWESVNNKYMEVSKVIDLREPVTK